MSALRRGFKANAERISSAVRDELGLSVVDKLDCFQLADYLGVPVVSLRDLKSNGASQKSINRLLSSAAKFSAMTICLGTRRIIVFNPRHSMGRKSNSLAHEISHIILEHPPSPPVGDGGCRHWDDRLESEADWLAGALLVPRDGALAWFRNGGTKEDGPNHFGVSSALFNWRINQTGVARQLMASNRYRR